MGSKTQKDQPSAERIFTFGAGEPESPCDAIRHAIDSEAAFATEREAWTALAKWMLKHWLGVPAERRGSYISAVAWAQAQVDWCIQCAKNSAYGNYSSLMRQDAAVWEDLAYLLERDALAKAAADAVWARVV